jgi:hypothetical protein
MSIQFKPFKRGDEEYYDNQARGLRTLLKNGQYKNAKEFNETLDKMDTEWAKEGEQ